MVEPVNVGVKAEESAPLYTVVFTGLNVERGVGAVEFLGRHLTNKQYI